MAIGCWVYTDIPQAGKGWTLAVLAVSRADADNYVKIYNGGGRCVQELKPAGPFEIKVKANCGAITSRAEELLR